jgi:hypothetical protein
MKNCTLFANNYATLKNLLLEVCIKLRKTAAVFAKAAKNSTVGQLDRLERFSANQFCSYSRNQQLLLTRLRKGLWIYSPPFHFISFLQGLRALLS